jgi:hypothetical protein
MLTYRYLHEESTLKDIAFSYPVGHDSKLLREGVKNYTRLLKKIFKDKPLRLICRGSSGSLICGGILATGLLNVENIFFVRKENENCHGGSYISDQKTHLKNIVVDDFVSMGYTMTAIHGCLKKEDGFKQIDALIVSGTVSPSSTNMDFPVTHLICGSVDSRIKQFNENRKINDHVEENNSLYGEETCSDSTNLVLDSLTDTNF